MEHTSHRYSDGLDRTSQPESQAQAPSQVSRAAVQGGDVMFRQLLTRQRWHSAPWGEQNDLPSSVEAKQVYRERLKDRWEHLGAETALDVHQASGPRPSPCTVRLSAEIPRCYADPGTDLL